MVSSKGTISRGALAITATSRVIFSSGLLPSVVPSRTIFRAMALVASPQALSWRAAWMICSSFSMAVLGKPFFSVSSTSFHCASREAAREREVLIISPTITATKALFMVCMLSNRRVRRNQYGRAVFLCRTVVAFW